MKKTPNATLLRNNRYGETEKKRVAKAAGTIGLATLLSRVFGFIRDMVVAGLFGAGLATDAFFVAFRIPNLLRRLFAEGSLTIAFVPVFTECLEKRTKKDAIDLANAAFTLLSIILVAVSLLGIIFSPYIVKIIAPGFAKIPDKYQLTVFLTRLMFPYIFFISLVALCMGILNSLRHFAAPAIAPVALNISMIFAALWLRDYFDEPVVALAIGVMAGGIIQLAMQFPFLLRVGVKLKPDFHFNNPGLKRIGILMLPAVFGAAVYQINIFISTLLASLLPGGSVSYLYYADRIVQLPLGIFAIAIGTASLPSFSEHAARGDLEELKKTISFSLSLILFVTVPAMVALIVLRVPIISVLFQRGEFNALSTVLTAQALFFYALGLWAFSVIRVIVSAFYSLQDTKTPVKVAVIALTVNIIMGIILMFPLKHGGLALATSIASAVNAVILFFLLRKKLGPFLEKDFYISFLKVAGASLVMGFVILAIDHALGFSTEQPFLDRLIILAVAIFAGLVVFTVTSYVMKSREMVETVKIVGEKLKRR
ncbi:MAG: murein biosynthesis integral membrane protein MurJ [Deltaproteobacteria bacterium]|nr:murein biosynthesis integral membrane protein MurJ [Deltaproteobacteria bacterium]